MLNSTAALIMLKPEKNNEMAAVVGKFSRFPLQSVNVTLPITSQGLGILPLKINQS
jgi:hypothetical protein